MSTRDKIIQRIKTIDREDVLESILSLITVESNLKEPYDLKGDELSRVEEGIRDADDGKVLNQEAVDNLVSKWFIEKSNGL